MVKGKLMMVKRLGKAAGDELVMDTWMPPMVYYPIVDGLGISLVCTTLIFSLRKGIHAEHLHWDLMRKAPTAWANLYRVGSLIMGNTIYSRDGNILIATACPTRGHWFGKLMRGSKLSMEVIKNQYFGITCNVVKALMDRWEEEWKGRKKKSGRQREVSCLVAAVVIGFGGGLR